MVRFSDLLGGNDDQEDAPAAAPAPRAAEPVAAPEPEAEAEIETIEDALAALSSLEPPPAPSESPQEVLDRLTQYATSARSGDPVAEIPEPAPQAAPPVEPAPAASALSPVGDDLLPRSGAARKPARGRKRRTE